jgi:opacity protein-like surface antigen
MKSRGLILKVVAFCLAWAIPISLADAAPNAQAEKTDRTGPVGKFDFGAGAGVAVVGEGIGGTYYLSGSLRYFIMENVAVEGEIGYWRKTYSWSTSLPVVGTIKEEIPASDLTIGVNAYYVYPLQTGISALMGGGIGINFQKVSGQVSWLGERYEVVTASETDASLRFIGGIEYSVSKNAKVFGIVRYDISGPSVFKVYGGFRFGP